MIVLESGKGNFISEVAEAPSAEVGTGHPL
jgi:hypothetical protein